MQLNDAVIIQPDVECTNGMYHVIDRVLIPRAVEARWRGRSDPGGRDAVSGFLPVTGDGFNHEEYLCNTAGIGIVHHVPGPYTGSRHGRAVEDRRPYTPSSRTTTLFAVPRSELDSILDDIDRLTDILNYHIVPGVHSAIDLLGIRALRSLQGEDLTVDIAPEGVLVNNVPVIETDAWCTNGICHAIYMLLLPPGVRAAAV